MRISDTEREQVVARLNAAVSEGRLTLVEFEERVDGVLRSRTYGEVEPFLADLPGVPPVPAAMRDVVEVRNQGSSLKRAGRWAVPRRLVVTSKAGSVKFNFTDALIATHDVEIGLDIIASSVELVLPAGAAADIDDIEQLASSAKSTVPTTYGAQVSGVRFHITGKLRASSLKVRYERRFWRWRW
jgi:hypothetical protein